MLKKLICYLTGHKFNRAVRLRGTNTKRCKCLRCGITKTSPCAPPKPRKKRKPAEVQDVIQIGDTAQRG